MSFKLTDTSVVLDGNDFDALAEATTGKHYFAERIGVDGIFDYGLVTKGNEVQISLADNGINTPLIIDRVVALADNGTADEVIFTLYRKVERGLQEIGKQRFFNAEMPVDYPDGIIFPDMVLGVMPIRANAIIAVYVKPVKILFTAVPNPQPVVADTSNQTT